jgi:UDP-glucose 4-epimerase
MNVLVLGGAGFIGSHIIDALVSKGHGVKIFDLANIGKHNLLQCVDSIEIYEGDFSNIQELAHALTGVNVIIHLICTTLPGPSNENPVYDVDTNVIGTLNLLDEAVKKGVKKIIFASSGGTVYGIPKQLPIPETHPTDPICSYGISKLTIEKYLALYQHLHGLDYTVLRLGNPYGERQRISGVQGAIAVFLGNVLFNRPLTIWGDGTVSRDYFHISDLVSAVMCVLEKDTSSKIFNIAGGEAYSLNQIVALMQEVTGKKPDVHFTPVRALDVPVNCLDISRAQKELDWKPIISLKEGIARSWEWLQHEEKDKMIVHTTC